MGSGCMFGTVGTDYQRYFRTYGRADDYLKCRMRVRRGREHDVHVV